MSGRKMNNGTGSAGPRLPPGFGNLVSNQGTEASEGFGKFSEGSIQDVHHGGDSNRVTKKAPTAAPTRATIAKSATKGFIEGAAGPPNGILHDPVSSV
jgi:hypothetical protein